MHLHQFKCPSKFIYLEGSPEQGGGGEKSETPKEEKSYEERLLEQRKAREKSPGGVGEINQENLTDSSKWSTEILEEAKTKMAGIDTKEEARSFILEYGGRFMQEYGAPTRGEVFQVGEGETQRYRVGTVDDWRQIYLNTLDMRELLEAVCKIYEIDRNDHLIGFDYAVLKAKRRTDEETLNKELEWVRGKNYPRYTPPTNPEQE